jgi:hypothetical protein
LWRGSGVTVSAFALGSAVAPMRHSLPRMQREALNRRGSPRNEITIELAR